MVVFEVDIQSSIDSISWPSSSRNHKTSDQAALREKCPIESLFWSMFSCIRTEYGDLRSDDDDDELLLWYG